MQKYFCAVYEIWEKQILVWAYGLLEYRKKIGDSHAFFRELNNINSKKLSNIKKWMVFFFFSN